MEIDYGTKKLRKTCASERKLKQDYPNNCKRIKMCIGILAAAPNLGQVPTGSPTRCHQLKRDRKGQFAVSLIGKDRLIFEPDHNPLPRKEDGGLDLQRITKIRILEVDDYHGPSKKKR